VVGFFFSLRAICYCSFAVVSTSPKKSLQGGTLIEFGIQGWSLFTDRDRDRMADVGTIDKYEMQLLEKKRGSK
jgi:hypothetical protein